MSARTTLVSVSIPAIAFFLACGGAEQAEPDAAAEGATAKSFQEARDHVETLSARLDELGKARVQAAERVEQARAALKDAEKQLAESGKAVDETKADLARAARKLAALQPRVPDEELFRHVQSALLESKALAKVAIRAEVRDGRVTLHGTVPEDRLRAGAEDVAKGIPGVRGVDNQIAVVRPKA